MLSQQQRKSYGNPNLRIKHPDIYRMFSYLSDRIQPDR